MACGLAGTAIAPVLPAALAALATVGIGWACFLGTTIATLQSADPRMLGRVMSLFALVLLGGTAAGAPVASALSASLGPRAPFFAGTAAAIAALAIAMGSTRTASTQAGMGSASAQGRPESGTRPPIFGMRRHSNDATAKPRTSPCD
jgi:MFS family permease